MCPLPALNIKQSGGATESSSIKNDSPSSHPHKKDQHTVNMSLLGELASPVTIWLVQFFNAMGLVQVMVNNRRSTGSGHWLQESMAHIQL